MVLLAKQIEIQEIKEKIEPKFVINYFTDGKLSYIEAHRLILECCRNEDKDFLIYWNLELAFAAELKLLGKKLWGIH